ncbi:GntR family transcriptional regulator [Treponema sp. HNW]|uniref:GntR family transcriptional regulator n=1 Tax=Treponema sp. HNW TaxID=3116654 RepID=UPI003D0A33E8
MSGKSVKSEQIYRYLRQYIDQHKFSDLRKLPSEQFLCNRFSVCRETVRKAIKRLMEEDLAYSIQGSGTFFNNRKAVMSDYTEDRTKLQIALVIQGQDREANRVFIHAVRSSLKPYNVELKIFFTDNKIANERRCLQACMKNVHGIIIDGVKASLMNPNIDCYEQIYNKNIPFIFYNNYYSGTPYPKIIVDDQACADALVKELTIKGHKNIAGLFLYDNYQGCNKFQGFVRAVLKYGAVFDDNYIKWIISDELNDTEQLKHKIWHFLKTIPDCTAVACCNVMLYKCLTEVFSEKGKRIPNDYSVVCFDYSHSNWETEGITCSVTPEETMGKMCAKMLMKMIADPAYKEKKYSEVLAPHIHYGKSIGTLV